MNTLFEGGNVFKDGEGQPVTQRINQTDIKPTVLWLEQLTGMDLRGNPDSDGVPEKWLGSTGRKDTSGDLDIEIDANSVSKDQLTAHLSQWAQSHGFEPKDWVRKTGSIVHLKTPIAGNPDNGYVQTDFTFLTKPAWSRFVLSADPKSAYKGAARNVLINSLAKSMGYKLNQVAGLADRATNELVSDDPDQVAKILLNKNATRRDLTSVESILQALSTDPNRDAKLADFKAHMEREGTPLQETVGTPVYTEVNFLARLRDRIVNKGYVPLVEHQHITEAKDPRIPHLEDRVFQKGVAGVDEVLAILNDSAKNTKKYVTIKWDGKPAIFFGRKPTGEFVLTDKSGLGAVGYDGLATSPKMIASIMARRDAAAVAKGKTATRANELVPMYKDIWPYFEAATPDDFRGFVKGDLLYYPQKPYVEEAGNFVFQPNEVLYRIPVVSDLGQQINGTVVGIAIHTQIEDATGAEQPINPNLELNHVNGLMMSRPTVKTLQPLTLNNKLVTQIRSIKHQNRAAIDQLLNANDLRAMKITDLPKLMESFINSLVGTDFSGATPAGFNAWLEKNVTANKFQNILQYQQSPRSNVTGMAAIFTLWNLLHQLKTDVLRQLDLQQPGQEGWVLATPAGRVKAVNRTAGGFTAANRARNNPPAA